MELLDLSGGGGVPVILVCECVQIRILILIKLLNDGAGGDLRSHLGWPPAGSPQRKIVANSL